MILLTQTKETRLARIGIVTDSTCDLGPARIAELGVVMVPLKVSFGDETFRDWIDLEPARFYEMLRAAVELPKTSQPSPADFAAEYRKLADAGCEGIVSIHLSAAISGTFESAVLAAGMVDVPVRVVDSLSANAGLALSLIAATQARDLGLGLDEIEAAAEAVARSMRTLFALDTLEYLVKGGRAGRTQGLAASLLSIKPVLTFDQDGVIEPYKKVKGTKRAIQEIAEAISSHANGELARVGILHGDSPDLASELVAAIDATGVRYEIVATSTVGAVIGTYTGPRAVGAAFVVVR